MSNINKSVSGFIYQESFKNLSLLWTILPIDRVIINSDNIQLTHGADRATMTILSPSDDYVLQARITHTPMSINDIGGIFILSTTGDQIECQTYFGDNEIFEGYYEYIKVVKTKNVFTFFASIDSIKWNEIGNAELEDANRIGFFLDGDTIDCFNDFRIFDISFYKSNIIALNNLFSSSTISLTDINNNEYNDKMVLKRSNDNLYLDMTCVLLPIKNATLTLYDRDNNVLAINDNIDISGGDVYEHTMNISFLLDGVLVTNNTIIDVGRLQHENNYYTLTIINNDTVSLIGVTLSIMNFSDYYMGEKFALIALPENVNGLTQYRNKLILPEISSNDRIDISVNIKKNADNAKQLFTDQYRFKILLQ